MDLDREIALVFLEEARGHLRTLGDTGLGRARRQEAAHALEHAAGVCGLGAVKAAAGEAERVLGAGGAGDDAAVRAVIDRVGALLDGIAEEVGAPEAETSGGDPGFDADETKLLRSFFIEEAHDHLEGITQALLGLQQDPGRRPLVDELLRKTHTLKGSAATVGLGGVSKASHRLEEAFAEVRAGHIAMNERSLDLLMAAVDELRAIVEAVDIPEVLPTLAERLGKVLAAVP